jgi:CubicO group peptidase (beta-lactamase class C family)
MTKRRTITFIAVAMVVALIFTTVFVDWRFWYRWNTLPTDPGEWPASYYQPIVELPGEPADFFPVAEADERTIDTAALEAAAAWAEAHNSAALIVLHKGVVQFERYWQDIGPDSLFSGRAMTRSLLPPLFAIAMQEGAIESLDDPVGMYLAEWRDDPRGQITLRQLLHNVSGLENPLLSGDPDPASKNARERDRRLLCAVKCESPIAGCGFGIRNRRSLRGLFEQPPVGAAGRRSVPDLYG